MDNTRIDILAKHIYDHVWLALDGEADCDGMTAGRIATNMEAFFRQQLEEECPDPPDGGQPTLPIRRFRLVTPDLEEAQTAA